MKTPEHNPTNPGKRGPDEPPTHQAFAPGDGHATGSRSQQPAEQPDQQLDHQPEVQPEDRFPAVLLAGPGLFGLMFASIAPKAGNSGGFLFGIVGGVIAAGAFTVLAKRAKTDKERYVWIAFACAGPLFIMAEFMRRI